MQPMRALRACSVLVASLWLAPSLQAQAPVDISHERLVVSDQANAAGQYGKSLLVDRNVNGILVGGFTFPTHTLPEGSFAVRPPTTPGAEATVRLLSAGPDCTWTAVQAINRHPATVGWCYIRTPTLETVEGFYRSESGNVTRLRYPGARLTEAHGVNDNHLVIGWYETWSGEIHAFTWNRATGQYHSVDAPVPGVTATIGLAVTNAGDLGVLYFTATGMGVAVRRQGQWSTLTAPGIGFSSLEDLGEDGRVLLLGSRAGEVVQSVLWEHGVVTLLTWPTRHVRFTHARGLSGDLVIGHVDWDLPVPLEDPPPAAETIFQGFVANLDALRGEVVTPPPPASLARTSMPRTIQVSAEAAPAPPSCPDEPRGAGSVQGRLAQSWVLCGRLR